MTDRRPREVTLLAPPHLVSFFATWVAPRLQHEAGIQLVLIADVDPSASDLDEVDLAAISARRIEELMERGQPPNLGACADAISAAGLEVCRIGEQAVGLRLAPFAFDTVLISSGFDEDEQEAATSVLDLVRVGATTLQVACTSSPPPEGKVCAEAVRLFTHPSCKAENLPSGAPCPPGKTLPPWFPKLKCFYVLEDRPGCVHSTSYNCLAWVLGRTDSWVWPQTCMTVDDLRLYLQAFGWVPTNSPDPECGKRKAAVFGARRTSSPCHSYRDVADGTPLVLATHVARESYDGNWWTSKLGQSFRIVHRLHELEGHLFGQVLAVVEKSDASANKALCSPFPDTPRR